MKRIVTIGGGTGSYTVLSGIRDMPDISITALVSMADDGGSTGVLRKKWRVMPPGDVRQCLAALSGKNFLNNKFGTHKIGNIILAVLEKITGSFNRGLQVASFVLGSKGKIIPITHEDVILQAKLKNNSTPIVGENNIDTKHLQGAAHEDLVENISYTQKAEISSAGKTALVAADYIIIGPGNIYCSIIPNFITEGFKETLKKSRAKIFFIMNLVNKPGHTAGWNPKQYVDIVEKYLGKKVDFILANNKEFSPEQKKHYLEDAGPGVFLESDYRDPRVIWEDLLLDKIFTQDKNDLVKRSLIRHDPEKLAEVIKNIISK